MKKILSISLVVFVFVLISSCSLFNEFKESKVTFVNGSDYNISNLEVYNGSSGVSKGMSYNVLDENGLAPGEKVTVPLVSILMDGSYAMFTLLSDDSSLTYSFTFNFTYEEGSNAKITFIPNTDGEATTDDFVVSECELYTSPS